MSQESGVVRDILNSNTTIVFRIEEPGKDRLLLKQHARWFVRSGAFKRTPVIGDLRGVWEDHDGGVWLETSDIDDMASIVEREYGEKGIHRLFGIEITVPPTGRRPIEVAIFPVVVKMLEDCEKRVAEMSAKAGVPMEILYDGGTEYSTFRIGAKIESPPADREALKLKILMAAALLKEAHKEVVGIVWPPRDDAR